MIVVLVLKMTWRLEVCLPVYHSKYWSAIEMQLVFSLVDEICVTNYDGKQTLH